MAITEVTRLALQVEVFDMYPWHGRLSDIDFLDRLYDLDELQSTDSRYSNARADIVQHRHANEDWDDDWVFSDPRFELQTNDSKLLAFIAEMLHPAVRLDQHEVAAIASVVNRLLSPDGYELSEVGTISGRAVFGAVERTPGPYVPAPSASEPDPAQYDHLWRANHIRAFLSHISEEHRFVSEVNDELRQIGIDGFVAHVSIEPDAEWQEEIERALVSCDVFVGLLHPGFSQRHWTQQEVGWALGRGIPMQMIRLGENPVGFRARIQARSPRHSTPWSVASSMAVGLSTDSTFGQTVVESLVRSLAQASSFVDGRIAAERLEEVGRLSSPVLDAIEIAYLRNDQLYPRHVGGQVVERILREHDRELPSR
jgi:AbiJ N-terminal domain 3/TIR domain